MKGILSVLAIGLALVVSTVADAACSSCGSCSNGTCNRQQASVSVSANADTIDQQQQQIRQLQAEIQKLSSTLRDMKAQRAIVNSRSLELGDDESIVQVGRSDEGTLRIQPIQLRNTPTPVAQPAPIQQPKQTTVIAPRTRVQTGTAQRSGSRWNR